MKEKRNVGKKIAYCIGLIAIILSGIVIYNYNMYSNTNDLEIENYIYLEPEVNFVDNLTLKQGEQVKVLDLVKNASNCVILDKDEYVDTSSVGIKDCTLKVTDDAGIIKDVNFKVNIIE
ncbi:MAG: hypothetical protein Q4D02_08055 [Clostridia bacterium]|nr:hypothetical protein [Clostridia bacterium]